MQEIIRELEKQATRGLITKYELIIKLVDMIPDTQPKDRSVVDRAIERAARMPDYYAPVCAE